jgi:hypothetical protein
MKRNDGQSSGTQPEQHTRRRDTVKQTCYVVITTAPNGEEIVSRTYAKLANALGHARRVARAWSDLTITVVKVA